MDGESVDEPSRKLSCFTEAFMAMLPSYMAMGMPPEEYWTGPAYLAAAYREAYEMRRTEKNRDMWMQGAYIYDTLLRVSPMFRMSMGKSKIEPEKYIEEPYPMTQKEADARALAQKRQQMERMIAVLNKESEKNVKERRTSENVRTD